MRACARAHFVIHAPHSNGGEHVAHCGAHGLVLERGGRLGERACGLHEAVEEGLLDRASPEECCQVDVQRSSQRARQPLALELPVPLGATAGLGGALLGALGLRGRSAPRSYARHHFAGCRAGMRHNARRSTAAACASRARADARGEREARRRGAGVAAPEARSLGLQLSVRAFGAATAGASFASASAASRMCVSRKTYTLSALRCAPSAPASVSASSRPQLLASTLKLLHRLSTSRPRAPGGRQVKSLRRRDATR